MKVLFPKARYSVLVVQVRKARNYTVEATLCDQLLIVLRLPRTHLLNIIIAYLAKMIRWSGLPMYSSNNCFCYRKLSVSLQHHLCRTMQHFSLQQQGQDLQSSACFSSGSCQVTAVGPTLSGEVWTEHIWLQ